MKIAKLLLILLSISCLNFAKAQITNIIPEPYQITKGNGIYSLPTSIVINAPASAKALADDIASKISTTTGRVVNFSKSKPTIDLQIVNNTNLGA